MIGACSGGGSSARPQGTLIRDSGGTLSASGVVVHVPGGAMPRGSEVHIALDPLGAPNPKLAATVALRQSWQLTRRLDLAHALGFAVPSELAECASLRKKVAHSSYAPTEAEATFCAGVSEKAVRALTDIEPLRPE